MTFQAYNSITFSLDLETAAGYHITFLKTVDAEDNLKNEAVLRHAIYRYEKFWLPLAAEHHTKPLTAPLDIEWVWHCHMLSPRAYARDCEEITGKYVNHLLVSPTEVKQRLEESLKLWQKDYAEPFYVDFSLSLDTAAANNFKSKISYNILEAAKRQGSFVYEISLPHFIDSLFLSDGLMRYKKFIYLKQKNDEFLVPCYDIDLIWHTHQLHPWNYKKDMMKHLGNLFNHDDNVERGEGLKLHTADMRTRELWKQTFGEQFSKFGAMYRGNPPAGKLYQLTSNDVYRFSTKKAQMQIDKVSLSASSRSNSPAMKLVIAGCAGRTKKTSFMTLRRPKQQDSGQMDTVWKADEIGNQGNFYFDTRYCNNLMFEVTEKTGFACCSSSNMVGSNVYNLIQEMEEEGSRIGGRDFHAKVAINEMMVEMAGEMAHIQQGNCLFFLDKGTYTNAIVPENIQSLWGPVNLERLPAGTGNRCQVASHRLKNHVGSVEFTCRVIHSLPLLMSVIQVYHHDKLAVIGHLIGSDQLPLPTQVRSEDKCVTLNPKAGERAVLIKNMKGDWGIITGNWTGFKKGVAGTTQKIGVMGNPGSLSVRFYKMVDQKFKTQTLQYTSNNWIIKLASMSTDLMKGIVEVGTTSNEVAENLCLSFAVSLLHVLCVPRPKHWKEGQRVKPKSTTRGTQAVKSIPSDDMAFIVAAGLLYSTPSNFYIRGFYGPHFCAMCGAGCGSGNVGDYSGFDNDLSGGCGGGDAGGCGGGDGGDGGACGGDGGGGGCGGCCGCGGGGCGGGCGGCGA